MKKAKKDASRRVTIVMPTKLNTQVRNKQSRRIELTQKNVSFSSIICQLVRKGLAA